MTIHTSEAMFRVTIRDLLYVLFKNKRHILLTMAVALGGAVLYLGFAKPNYKAEASILIKLGKDEMSAIEAIPSERNNFLLQQRGQIINNEIEILRSEALVRVVAPLAKARMDADAEEALRKSRIKRWIKNIKDWVEPAKNSVKEVLSSIGIGHKLTPEQAFLIETAKGLKIEAIEETEVIRLSYSSSDSEFSAFMANTFLDAYHTLRQRVHGNNQSEQFYETQIELFRARLQESESRLDGFLKSNGITNLVLQKELLVRDIAELEKQKFQSERSIAETTMRKQTVAQAARDEIGVIPTVSSNRTGADYATLDEAYFKLTADRAKLETKYTANSRELSDVIQQQTRLKREKSVSVERAVDSDLAGEKNDHDAIENRLKQLKQELVRLNAATFTLAELEDTRDAVRNNYLAYQKKAEELRISTDLDHKQITSVKTVSRAFPPPLPTSPKPMLLFLLALVVGVFFSFAYAVIAEFFNHTFRDDRDVTEHLGLTTLGSINLDPNLKASPEVQR